MGLGLDGWVFWLLFCCGVGVIGIGMVIILILIEVVLVILIVVVCYLVVFGLMIWGIVMVCYIWEYCGGGLVWALLFCWMCGVGFVVI